MSLTRILIATDEVSIVPDYAKQLFESPEWFGDDPAPVTRQMSGNLMARGFLVDFAKLDEIADSLEVRSRLGRTYHAACILTIRVWKIGAALRSAIESVRQLPDAVQFDSGVRVNCLPITIANPMNMLGHAKGYSADLEWISKARWVSTQTANEEPFETLIRGIGDWQAELVSELDYCGYGVSIDVDGQFEVYPYFQRTRAESVFFDATSSVAKLRQHGFLRLSKDAVAISDSLRALEDSLNSMAGLDAKQQEARLQECLEKHPILITQGVYDTVWSRRTLQNPDPLQKSVQPDFVMAPSNEWESILRPRILEIKTSEKQALRAKDITGFLLDALDQLMSRYRRFYEDTDTHEVQKSVYGRIIERPSYALLVGRRLSADSAEAWKDAREQSKWNEVKLITYDDVLDFARERVRLHQQVQFRLSGLITGI